MTGLFGDDGEEIVDVDADEMGDDIDDEDVDTLVGGGYAIGATRALNNTFATLERSVIAAGDKQTDFSILWGSSQPPATTTKRSSSGEESENSSGVDDDEADDEVSPEFTEFTPFVAKVNSFGAEAPSTNGESLSIATPAIHLCQQFDTAMSIGGRSLRSKMSAGSSHGSGRPPMARPSIGSRASSSGSRVSYPSSVQLSTTSQTISLMTSTDKNTAEDNSAKLPRTATKSDIKPLLGDLESPMSGASDLLLPSPSPEKNKSAAVSLSSASGEEEDASAFIESVASELIDEDRRDTIVIQRDEAQSTGPPSLINSVDGDDASRSTLTHSIVLIGAKQKKAANSGAIVNDVKEKSQIVVATAGGSFALVPSTYEFTPKDQRQPALTKEAMQNASFLFSPNNMGRVAIQQKIAEKNASRKARSALERYSTGLRTSTEPLRIGCSHNALGGDVSHAGTRLASKTPLEAVSSRVNPDSSAATPVPHDKGAASARFESTPQPIVSPSESVASSSSSINTKSMVHQSAVTPWKTASPFQRFNQAKKIFGKEKQRGQMIERLVSTDEDEAKSGASEASAPSDHVQSSGGVDDVAPDDELESFVTATSREASSPAADFDVKKVRSMVSESAVTPFKTNSPAVRFHENKMRLEKATIGAKLVTTSATSHAGRLRRNRMVIHKNPRRETGGSGVLAPHRSNLVNPMFASQPLIEDEVTVYSENQSLVPSVQQQVAAGDEEQSTISSVLSIAKECVALSSANAPDAASGEDGADVSDDGSEDEGDDDFSLALKSHVTSSTIGTVKNEIGLGKERSVRFSASTRAADASKKPSWAGGSSRSIVLADSFDEESLVSSQYTADKENMMTTPQQPRLAHGRTGLVDPRRQPIPGTSALCLSPSARTPFEQSKWRELAQKENSQKTSSAKKLLSSGKKRLSSSKKRLSSSGKKKLGLQRQNV